MASPLGISRWAVPGKKQSLGRVFLFDHLAPAEAAVIDKMCVWSNVRAGETIVAHGDKSHDIFFLLSGKSRVLVYSSAGKLMPLRLIQGGDFFGEMSALDGLPRSASVEAETACVVARMPAKSFQALLANDAAVNRKLMLHFVNQIRSLTGRVYELGTFDLGSRISAEVLRLAADDAKSSEDDFIIRISSKTQLAHQLGATREAVSREMKRLVASGALAPVTANTYRCNGARLRNIIEGRPTRRA